MSKKAHSNLRFLATDHALDEGGAHELHERDQTGRPKKGLAGVSDPRRSQYIHDCLSRIDHALSESFHPAITLDSLGWLDAPQPDEESMGWKDVFAEAGLSQRESQVMELRFFGFSAPGIARLIGVKQPSHSNHPYELEADSVRTYLRRGSAKLWAWREARSA